MPTKRARPLVLIATPNRELAERLADQVRRDGSIACVARSSDGCLRVATSVGPDVLLLDARLAGRLRGMLRSHPATAGSIILRVSDEGVLPTDYSSAALNSGRERVRTARATDSVA